MDDLRIIEPHRERSGLIAVSGKWQGFEEVAGFVEDLESLRLNAGMGRDVSI